MGFVSRSYTVGSEDVTALRHVLSPPRGERTALCSPLLLASVHVSNTKQTPHVVTCAALDGHCSFSPSFSQHGLFGFRGPTPKVNLTVRYVFISQPTPQTRSNYHNAPVTVSPKFSPYVRIQASSAFHATVIL